MPKNNTAKNQTLDDSTDKTPEALHAEWLRCLEESALAHKELKDANAEKRKALDAWAERQASGPLDDGGARKVDRKLLRAYNVAKQAAEEARVARDNEQKAWEATGLPAARSPRIEDDESDEVQA